MKTKMLMIVGLTMLLVPFSGLAQAPQSIRANIPFRFVVKGVTMPAGEYYFARVDDDKALEVKPVSKGTSVQALVITRLGAITDPKQKDARLVFDRIGDDFFLSEFWIPETDGFLLYSTPQKHEHRKIFIRSS